MRKVKKYFRKLGKRKVLTGNSLLIGLLLVGIVVLAMMMLSRNKLDYRTLAQSSYPTPPYCSGEMNKDCSPYGCIPDSNGGTCESPPTNMPTAITSPTAVPTVCQGCVLPNCTKTCIGCPADPTYIGWGYKKVDCYDACTGLECPNNPQTGFTDTSCGWCQAGITPTINLTPTCQVYECSNTCGLGGCHGGCGSKDNCGGVDCADCGGATPTSPPAPPPGCRPAAGTGS